MNIYESKAANLSRIHRKIPNISLRLDEPGITELAQRYLHIFLPGPYFYVIFNTYTQKYEYKSKEVEAVLGLNPDEFNLLFVLNNIHPEDLSYFYLYEQKAVEFFGTLPPEQVFSYKFAFDFRMKNNKGEYKRFYMQTMPFAFLTGGGAKTFTVMTDITHLDVQGIPKLSFIGLDGMPSRYNIYPEEAFFPSEGLFTKREKELLGYIVKGMSSREISEQLHRSIHTINAHRKNILRKSGCSTVNELLVTSVREGWV